MNSSDKNDINNKDLYVYIYIYMTVRLHNPPLLNSKHTDSYANTTGYIRWCGWRASAKIKLGHSNFWRVEMPAVAGGSFHEVHVFFFFRDFSMTWPPCLFPFFQDVQFLLLDRKWPKFSKVCEGFEVATWSSWLKELAASKILGGSRKPG